MKRAFYGADHEAYRETVREFLAREVVPHQDDWDREHWIDREMFARAAKAGIYSLQIGEEYGGAGEPDYRYRMVVSEEIHINIEGELVEQPAAAETASS